MAYNHELPIGSIVPFAGPIAQAKMTYKQYASLAKGATEKQFKEALATTATLAESGWLLCDGTLISINDPQLQDLKYAIFNLWGGMGATFRVPDLRGLFLRGLDIQGLRDTDMKFRGMLYPNDTTAGGGAWTVGSYQMDQVGPHIHSFTTNSDGNPNASGADVPLTWSRRGKETRNTNASTGTESRPKNVYVNYIIKASYRSINLNTLKIVKEVKRKKK